MNPFPPRFYVLAAASLFVASVVAGSAYSKDRVSSGVQVSPGREIVSLRTSHSRTFSAPGGKRVAVVYEGPVNYRDGKTWRAIDNRLVPERERGDGYHNHANRYSLRVPPNIGGHGIRIANEGDWLDLGLEGAHGQPSIEGNTATYDVSPGVSVTYAAESDSLNAEITLESARVQNAYRFTVEANKGVSLKNQDGAIVAVDSNNKVRFSLPAPSVIDDEGEIATGTEVSLDRRASSYNISIRINRDWLRARERSFPVSVDQIVSIEQTAADGSAVDRATTDCLIQDGVLKNTSLCSAPILGTGSLRGSLRRSLLRFDIAGSLPQGANVTDAQLGLFQWRHQGKKNVPIDLHLVTKPFTGAATWKRYDTGHPWASAGGDYVQSALASTNGNTESGFAWWDLSGAAALQAVADGSAENTGFLLKLQNERSNAADSFLASEYWNTTLRPRLEITYEQQENLEVPQAPELPKTGITPFVDQTSFLYTGSKPVQTGVAEGTIDPVRAAVVRGKVMTRAGDPLPGVTVTVLNHAEFGQTMSRVDGSIYMAVNGGGPLTVVLEKEGYLEAQRQVDVPWQDYVRIDDVVLVPLDSQVTEVDLTSGTQQVARGTSVTDSRGTRQGTLIFQPGTSATMTMPDGSKQALDQLGVRITEYTVGSSGPEAMPAELPPTSAYTYAAEYSADEALAASASEVSFSRPVITYTDNFLGFDVGSSVPAGYYNRENGQWVALDNGRVVKILSITNGRADLDIDGSGEVATASALASLGVTDEERRALAGLYQPGRSFWRVAVSHFSIHDWNWPFVLVTSGDGDPSPGVGDGPEDNPCPQAGCEIGIESQSLGENIQISGTPLKLRYKSERTPGGAWSLKIDLAKKPLPSGLKRIELYVYASGKRLTYKSLAPEPNLSYAVTWDGKDVFGRSLPGGQRVYICVGYLYDSWYVPPADVARSFALRGEDVPTAPALPLIRWAYLQTTVGQVIGAWDARTAGFGGWTLDNHDTYDPTARALYRGDGSQRSIAGNPVTALQDTLVAGSGNPSVLGDGGPARDASLVSPNGVKVAPDGTTYVADSGHNRIRRIGKDGTITTFAGNRSAEDGLGDGGPAADAWLSDPTDIALGSDGSVYVADEGNGRIRRIAPDGVITTIAGGGGSYPCDGGSGQGDGGPATDVALCWPMYVAAAPDGSVYFGERSLLRRIGTDGTLSTVANGGGSSGGGGVNLASLSTDAQTVLVNDFGSVGSIAVSRNGAIYFVAGGDTVRKIAPDGTMTTLAGHHESGGGDGGGGETAMSSARAMAGTDSASGADLGAEVNPEAIALAADGSLLIAEESDVLRLDTAGNVKQLPSSDLANNANWLFGIASAPNGNIYLTGRSYSQAAGQRDFLKSLEPPLPGFSDSDISFASEDGQSLDIFDKTGRHLQTIDALTGANIYSFSYDAGGRLIAITDGNGNVTHIERRTDGSPSAIIAPFGQRTTLQVDDNGYLSQITNPAGESINVQTSASGLLQSFTDANGRTNHFTFNTEGRLTSDENAAGYAQTLTQGDASDGVSSVVLTTPLGRATTYRTEHLGDGSAKRTVTSAAGISTQTNIANDGALSIAKPDGTAQSASLSPDPRHGMQAPYINRSTLDTPNGYSMQVSRSKNVTQIDPGNPFSASLTTETTIADQTSTKIWNGISKRFSAMTPEGRSVTTDVDEQRNPLNTQVSGFEAINYTYDDHGRLTGRTQGARSWRFGYDAAGNMASVTNPLGQIERYSYDLVGRLTKQLLPGGQVIDYAYDANGNQTSITPLGRQASTFSYDVLDQPLTLTLPDAGDGPAQTSYSWSKDGDLASITRPDGSTIDYGYDSAGRLENVTWPGSQKTYVRDSTTGKVTSVTGPGGVSLGYSYDGSLLLSETASGPIAGRIDWTYDNNLRVSSVSVDDVSVSYEYDNDGLFTKAGELSLERNQANNLVEGLSLDDVSTTYAHNGYGERTDAVTKYSSQQLLDLTYSYDGLGRISTKTEQAKDGTHDFVYRYDEGGHLVEAKQDGQIVEGYGYDSNSNRTSVIGSGGVTLNATYDAQDRLESFGSHTYIYSKNGDLISVSDSATAETASYDYDSRSILKAVTIASGKRIEYLTDPLDRRIGKKVNGELTQGFLYGEDLGPVAELDSDGSIKNRFVYGTSTVTPDYMIRSGTTYRIVSDERGSPRMVVNGATGEIVQELNYDSYGRVTRDTNPGFQPFGFAGGFYDSDTGLTHFGARDYDAETGRFISRDPINYAGGDVNLYAYTFGDPVNLIDPVGLRSWNPINIAKDVVSKTAGAVSGAAQAAYSTVSSVTSATYSELPMIGCWLSNPENVYESVRDAGAAAACAEGASYVWKSRQPVAILVACFGSAVAFDIAGEQMWNHMEDIVENETGVRPKPDFS